jgi:hypothetical protein
MPDQDAELGSVRVAGSAAPVVLPVARTGNRVNGEIHMLSITPDQMASAGSYISRQWGDHGYRIEQVESPTAAVSLFHVVASDGSRFIVAADKWGQCRDSDATDSADVRWLVDQMHAAAVAP